MTSFGARAAARTQQTTRPILQGPDTPPEGGGNGGGGTAPTAPSSITTVQVANKLNGWAGVPLVYDSMASFALWKTYGLNGWVANLANGSLSAAPGSGFNFGNTQRFKVSSGFNVISATGDASTIYQWQNAYQGNPIVPVNGGGTGLGVFKAKEAGHVEKVYLRVRPHFNGAVGGPFGDWWSGNAAYAAAAEAVGNRAAGCKFLGGDGIYLDPEGGNFLAAHPGHTVAERNAQAEARGYEFGTGLFTGFPHAEMTLYGWTPTNGWHHRVLINIGENPVTGSNALVNNVYSWYLFGMMRAAATLQSTGRWRFQDAMFYRYGTQISAADRTDQMQCQINGIMAMISQNVSATTRSWIMPRFDCSVCSWAGTDGTSAGQPPEPTWSAMQMEYRNWAMGGWRAEYFYNGDPIRQSTGPTTATITQSINYPNNDYAAVAGRVAGFQAAAAVANHPNTSAPTLTAAKSGSGTTRTLTGTAAHPYAIAWVRAYIYPSGTPVYASMTWNEAGGSYSGGFANAYQQWTLTLTGVATGNYAIVQTQSAMGHQKSAVLAL